MRRLVTLALLGLLLACGKHDPVAEDATAPPDALAGDEPADGLAAPANSATAEAVQQAAVPAPTDGLGWRYDNALRLASFGPAGPSPQLTIQCLTSIGGGPGGVAVVRADAPGEGKATLSFTGNGHVASLEINAVRRADHDGVWRGVARGDNLRAIRRTFDGPGPVEANIAGSGDLRLASGPEVRAALACRS